MIDQKDRELRKWTKIVGLDGLGIKLVKIPYTAANNEVNGQGGHFLGSSLNEVNGQGGHFLGSSLIDSYINTASIYYTGRIRRLSVEDLVHELVHLQHPEWSNPQLHHKVDQEVASLLV